MSNTYSTYRNIAAYQEALEIASKVISVHTGFSVQAVRSRILSAALEHVDQLDEHSIQEIARDFLGTVRRVA